MEDETSFHRQKKQGLSLETDEPCFIFVFIMSYQVDVMWQVASLNWAKG